MMNPGWIAWMATVLAIGGYVPSTTAPLPSGTTRSEAIEEELYGWNGDVPDVDGCTRRVADARVRMAADGDLAAAENELGEVWLLATALRGFEGQAELLVQLALARADLYQRQGAPRKALEATRRVLLTRADLEAFGARTSSLSKASKSLLACAAKAVADPRLVDLRAALAEPADAAPPESLDEIVEDSYRAREYRVIAEIGSIAQPTLARLIVDDADEFPPDLGSDPLVSLIGMNERRAAELLLEHLDAGGHLWRRRIIRAMDGAGVLTNDGTWSSQEPYACLEPEWLGVLGALLSSRATALESAFLLEEPFFRDQLSPRLQRAVIEGIEGFGVDFAQAAMRALDHGAVVASARPIFEAASRVPDPQLRRLTASILANYGPSEALQAMADDPDPDVRAAVASTLQPCVGSWVGRTSRSSGVVRRHDYVIDYDPTLDGSQRSLLAHLARDPSSAVRLSVARALTHLVPPLDDSVYVRLAGDADPNVRGTIAHVSGIAPELRSSLLETLANDPARSVVAAVDEVLVGAPVELDPSPFLAAIHARLTDRRSPMTSAPSRVVAQLVGSPRGLEALTGWVLDGSDRSLQDTYFRALGKYGFDRVLSLDDAMLAGVFARAHDYDTGPSSSDYQNLRRAMLQARPLRHGALRSLAADVERPMVVRVNAAHLTASTGGEALAEALLELVRSEYWSTSATESDLAILREVVERIPAADRNAFVLRVVDDGSMGDRVAAEVATEYSPAARSGREVTLAALERWFRPESGYFEVVEKAIRHLGALRGDPDLGDVHARVLEAAAMNGGYARAAVDTIVSLRQPGYLEVLARCLDAEWVTREFDRDRVRAAAAAGIASYATDEAAQVLLRGLTSSDEGVRVACAEGLDNIEATRQRQRRWLELQEAQATRESALIELLDMVDGEHLETRLQAIRGIATLGSIEHLPTLIRLLRDPNPKVVEAARASIDQLTRIATAERIGEAEAAGNR